MHTIFQKSKIYTVLERWYKVIFWLYFSWVCVINVYLLSQESEITWVAPVRIDKNTSKGLIDRIFHFSCKQLSQ